MDVIEIIGRIASIAALLVLFTYLIFVNIPQLERHRKWMDEINERRKSE